jgi:hypothetical protein
MDSSVWFYIASTVVPWGAILNLVVLVAHITWNLS